MSNDATVYPWVLDTAESVLAAGIRIRVKKMAWHPNATDNDLIVHDGNGNIKWVVRATAGAPNNESYGIERFDGGPEGELFDGFDIDTMDAGTLYVYPDRAKRR